MKLMDIFIHPFLLIVSCAGLIYAIRSTRLYQRVRFSSVIFTVLLAIRWTIYNLRISGRFPGYMYSLDALHVPGWIDSFLLFFGTLLLIRILDHLFFGIQTARKQESPVPVLLRDVITFVILIVVVLFILRTQFGIRPSALIATSAVLSAILGLALQDVLGNILAGIALHIERPFHVRDWIRVGDLEGRVLAVNWRATRILTHNALTVIFPNSGIARTNIVNFSKPARLHAETAMIGLPYGLPPYRAKEVLVEAMLSVDGVMHNPRPQLRLKEYGDFAIQYEMRFWISERNRHPDIMDDILSRSWYALKRNDITIPFPIRDVFLRNADKGDEKKMRAESGRIFDRLRENELFRSLSDECLKDISGCIRKWTYSKGEEIVKQGEGGDSLFILSGGTVSVHCIAPDGDDRLLNRLSEGDFFGELSLLTGEPRSATVRADDEVEVLVIEKGAFAPLIQKHAEIVENLSQVLSQRKAERDEVCGVNGEKGGDGLESRYKNIRNRINRFFGVAENK